MAYCCVSVSLQYHLKEEPEIWDVEAKSGLDQQLEARDARLAHLKICKAITLGQVSLSKDCLPLGIC